MKNILLFLAAMLFSYNAYAYCKAPDCKCFTDKCKKQRMVIRDKTGWVPEIKEVIPEEKESIPGRLVCYYKIPFTASKTYFFKMVTYDNTCREIFQIGYTDTMKLRAVVMKDEFESGMEIFHRPGFGSKENLEEYIEKQWGDAKIIHHKSLRHLR